MKRFLAIILAITLVFSLCSCGSTGNPGNAGSDSSSHGDDNKLPGNIPEETTDKNGGKPKTIKLNETFNVGEVMTITLKSSEWCEEIKPSNTSGGYSYMSDKEGEKYFVIRGQLKNLSSQTLDIGDCSDAELVINDKYKLSVFLDMEEQDGSGFYGYAKPLQTLNLVIYASVSDELYEICKDMKIYINIVNDDEKLNYYYDEEYPQDKFVISFTK